MMMMIFGFARAMLYTLAATLAREEERSTDGRCGATTCPTTRCSTTTDCDPASTERRPRPQTHPHPSPTHFHTHRNHEARVPRAPPSALMLSAVADLLTRTHSLPAMRGRSTFKPIMIMPCTSLCRRGRRTSTRPDKRVTHPKPGTPSLYTTAFALHSPSRAPGSCRAWGPRSWVWGEVHKPLATTLDWQDDDSDSCPHLYGKAQLQHVADPRHSAPPPCTGSSRRADGDDGAGANNGVTRATSGGAAVVGLLVWAATRKGWPPSHVHAGGGRKEQQHSVTPRRGAPPRGPRWTRGVYPPRRPLARPQRG